MREIYSDNTLTLEEKEKKIDDLRERFHKDTSSAMPIVTWLDDYTNLLAGKKAFSDRSWENDFGREMYAVANWFSKRVSSNLILGNLSTALTNFIPLFQASKVSLPDLTIGMKETL